MIAKETETSGSHPWLSWLVLLLLLGVALVLRWRYIQEISLFVDEFVTAWAARNVPRTGLPIFPSGNLYPHGFLFTYLEVPTVLGAFDETLARIPALLVSLAALPVAYAVGRRLLSESAGLVAAAAMAVDPDLIVWGGRARMYGLLQLLVLLTVYLYYRGLTEDRAGQRYAAMVLLVAAIFTHAEATFLLPVLALATVVAVPWRRLWRWSVALPLALGGAGAIAFYLLAKFGQPGHLEIMDREGRSYVEFSANLLGGPRVFAPVFTAPHRLAFGLLALVGLYFLFRPRFDRRAPLTYLYVVLGGLVALLAVLANETWQRERYLFLVLPLLFLIGGEVARRLLDRVHLGQRWPAAGRWLPAALAVLVAIYVGLSGAPRAYVQEWGYDGAFRYLQAHFRPEQGDQLATSMSTAAMLYLGQNDAFAIQQGYEEYIVQRPGDRTPVDLWTATPVISSTVDFVRLLDAAPRLWFVTDGWRFQTRYDVDFVLTVLQQMDLVYDQRGALVFRGQGYEPLRDPAFRRDRVAEFDDALALRGFALSDPEPTPGDELEVTLYWRALPSAGPAYTTLLHLVAPDGTGLAGVDEPLLQGLYQPDLWPADRTLPDQHRLGLPADLPPGRYRLELGLYPSGQPGQALPVAGGDRLPLASLSVSEPAPPPPSQPTNVDFGGQIRLLGYDLSTPEGMVDAAGNPQHAVQLTLHWSTITPVDQDYTVFAHLVDAQGTIVSQDDGPPGDPFFPTTTWLPGQVVQDGRQLILPDGAPAGSHTVLVGLYHRPTEARLSAVDAEGNDLGDALPLQEVP